MGELADRLQRPGSVALALRGPGRHAPFRPVPPSAGLASAPREVDREASAAASVLSACSAAAPARIDADLTAVVTGTPSVRLIDAGQAITVEYVATSGSRTVRTLSSLDLGSPCPEAWWHLRDAERVFTLSRIHSAMGAAPE